MRYVVLLLQTYPYSSTPIYTGSVHKGRGHSLTYTGSVRRGHSLTYTGSVHKGRGRSLTFTGSVRQVYSHCDGHICVPCVCLKS